MGSLYLVQNIFSFCIPDIASPVANDKFASSNVIPLVCSAEQSLYGLDTQRA